MKIIDEEIQNPRGNVVTFLKYSPNTEDIKAALSIDSEQSNHHGDIIDYERFIPFDDIPESLELENHYEGFNEWSDDELEEFRDNFVCKAIMSVGITSERGFQVHCDMTVFYYVGTGEDTNLKYIQGDFHKEWLAEVNEKLKDLGWNPEFKHYTLEESH